MELRVVSRDRSIDRQSWLLASKSVYLKISHVPSADATHHHPYFRYHCSPIIIISFFLSFFLSQFKTRGNRGCQLFFAINHSDSSCVDVEHESGLRVERNVAVELHDFVVSFSTFIDDEYSQLRTRLFNLLSNSYTYRLVPSPAPSFPKGERKRRRKRRRKEA